MTTDHKSIETMPAQLCKGCAWGPTPDQGTGHRGISETARIDGLIKELGSCVVVRVRCHRARYLDDVRTALGQLPTFSGVHCRGACDRFGVTLEESPVAEIDREFDSLVARNVACGPEIK